MGMAHDVGQVDGSNLACLEQVARRLVQHETAVERNPRSPDYSGLDLIMGAPTSASGSARVSNFSEYVSGRLKEQSAIWKNYRNYRNEFKHRGSPATVDSSDDDDDDPKGKGRGRGKKKKKRLGVKTEGGGADGPAAAS